MDKHNLQIMGPPTPSKYLTFSVFTLINLAVIFSVHKHFALYKVKLRKLLLINCLIKSARVVHSRRLINTFPSISPCLLDFPWDVEEKQERCGPFSMNAVHAVRSRCVMKGASETIWSKLCHILALRQSGTYDYGKDFYCIRWMLTYSKHGSY